MEDAVPKKALVKPFIPEKSKEMKPLQKPWIGKDRINDETRRELRRKKLCFSYKEPVNV
jgi:hypothetical protein